MPANVSAQELCLGCHKPHYRSNGSCSSCHRGNPATARKDLAHAGFVKGRYARFMIAAPAELSEWSRRVEQYGCRRCHTTSGTGNRLAADLDHAARQRSPDELVAAIRTPVKTMPDFRFSEKQIDELVNALQVPAVKSRQPIRAERQLVNFDTAEKAKEDLFSKKCGGCHKALTARLGALGRGATAPNLTGIFSLYYPKASSQEAGWNRKRLERWIVNPRTVKKEAIMQPVEITAAELGELVRILNVAADVVPLP